MNGSNDWNPLLLRIALGAVFVVTGVGKVFGVGPKASGIDGFAGLLASVGAPAPGVLAWLVALLELAGGLLLLAGLFTRVAALALSVDMLAATLLVHAPNGFVVSEGGYEYTLTLTLVSLALVLGGPGRLSLERAILGRELVPSALSEGRGGGGRRTDA